MIGVATTVFWLFLIVFFVSAVYSVKDLNLEIGQPQVNITSDNEMLFSLPIMIDNKGYYNIGDFNITTEVSDRQGSMITNGSTFIPQIRRAREITVTHNMTIDIEDLMQGNQDYLFNDTELVIHGVFGMKVAEVIPVQASTNFSLPWGAPLFNFTLDEIEYTVINMTHMRATVPISFENHALFDLYGSAQIRMYNDDDALISTGQTTIEAPQNTPYEGFIELDVSIADISSSGYFEVYFSTLFFDFGPLVIPYG